MGDFELDTRIAGSDGRYTAELSPDWAIWGPNGGYVATIALRAAGREAAIPRPVSFSCHFLSVARFESVELRVTCVRRGRRAESLEVHMSQDGRAILCGLLRTASEVPGLTHDATRPPEVPEPESLKTWAELFPDAPSPYPFWENIEGKPIDPGVTTGPPEPRPPALRQWNRFTPSATFEDPFVDAGRALLLLDTMGWPAASRPHPDAKFQAPNLDVTAWFHRADPGEPWLLSDHEGAVAIGGLMSASGRIWNRRGQLLASGGAQLMCVPVSA